MKYLLLAAGLLPVSSTIIAQQKPSVKSVVGKWLNCRESTGRTVVVRNVCPVISFFVNGTGQVVMETERREAFTWRQTGTKVIVQSEAANSPILGSDTYTLSQHPAEPVGLALSLTSTKGTTYTLFKIE